MKDTHYLKQELYKSFQQDKQIFEWFEQGSLDGIWYWDLIDQENEWLSPGFKTLFGYQEHEIPHTSAWWQNNIFPEDLALTLENFQKHVEDPDYPYDQIVRYKHKDGSTVWVRCRGLIIRDTSGTPIRMLGAHTNVTELKEAELALAAKQLELERSNRELEQFAFAASHDLKSPVNAIQRLIHWIEEDSEQLPENINKYFQNIKKRCNSLTILLEDLLEYSRAGDLEKQKETIQLNGFIHSIFDMLDKAQYFQLSVSEVEIEVEKVPFELVLRNLLSNAIKHHDKGAGHIQVNFEKGDEEYLIKVIDDGPGIPKKYHDKIMQMFQTLRSKNDVEGSGIGLAMVDKMLASLGGKLQVSSDGESGTMFVVTWPI